MTMTKIRVRLVTALSIMLATIVFWEPRAAADSLTDAKAAERKNDCSTAVSLYRALAARGVAKADERLGYFYEIGYCTERNWQQAARWYGKSIDDGNLDALTSISFIGRQWRYMYRGVPLDGDIYTRLETEAKKGSAVAQFSLGVINFPIGDIAFDPSTGNLKEAINWYRLAAEQGDVDSLSVLGKAYEDGLGVLQDFVEAHKFINLAASRVSNGDIRSDLIKRREDLAGKMTASQIGEAQKLAREWRPAR